ncbi:MAG: ATP-binding protein [Planctomycetota bacterium]
MRGAKEQRRLRAKILLRVVPITAIVMLAILWTAQQSIHLTIKQEVDAHLQQTASLTAEQLSRQLDLLRASVTGLAENDLIVNSIIDKEQRHYQLPVFFRSLQLPDSSFRRITMTDYAGRPVVSAVNGDSSSDHGVSIRVNPFRDQVMSGEEYFEVTPEWITVATPICYGGNPEGILAVQFDTRIFMENFQTITQGRRLRLLLDNNLVYQSLPRASDTVWNVAADQLRNYPELTAERAEAEEISFSAMQSLNFFLFGVLIAALVAVLGAVLAASMISTRPLGNIVSQIKSIESTNDLSRRVDLDESKEFCELSDSFNAMIETLSKTMVSLDKLTESETQLRTTNAKLRRSNEELEQFANVASHDLQEPLRIVTAYCELLREDCYDALSEDGHRYMRYVVDAAKRMRTLIQDLLAYSKIENQGGDLIQVNVNHTVASALDQMSEEIDSSHAKIVVETLPIVDADAAQLTQLFRQLIGNAIKYSGNVVPEIRIRAESEPDRWLLRVEDNGIGIEPEYCDRIFGIFQRLHRRDQYQGTGIGLAICKRIVDRVHGQIWVESELGVGSVFIVAIPKANKHQLAIGAPINMEVPTASEMPITAGH